MSTKTIITCDICEKETHHHTTVELMRLEKCGFHKGMVKLDLCTLCQNAVYKFLQKLKPIKCQKQS